ncbi:MAG: c-type cytochrome, partial [Pirellulales bacterium]
LYRAIDTNGDGLADRRDVLLGRFGFRDTHGMASSFTAWVDGWVYACHSYANTSTVKAADGAAVTMSSGNTWRFRADGSRLEQFTWGQVNPFGMCFDPLGNVFTADCHSMPVYMLLRGAHYPSFGKPDDGLGFGPTMLAHNHGSTGICGVVYYAAEHFPPGYRGTMFIGNPVTSRVNHDKLETRGSSYWAVEQPDFLTCDDLWFRPVDLKLGPDGALYIADFYNCIIGHYEVPLTHPRRDRERGRIWRVVYKGPKGDAPPLPPIPDFVAADVGKLIELLGHENLTVRVKATNQLVERIGFRALSRAKAATADSASALRRAHALWVVERLGGLDDDSVRRLLNDPDRLVRTHVLHALAERRERDRVNTFHKPVLERLDDLDGFVRRAAVDVFGRQPCCGGCIALLELLKKAPAEDTHLVHATRIALRDSFRRIGFLALGENMPKSITADEADWARIADVAVAVHTDSASRFLAKYVSSRAAALDAARTEAIVYAAARYYDDKHWPQTAALAETFAAAGPSRQTAALRSLRRAEVERGLALPPVVAQHAEKLAAELLGQTDPQRVQQGITLAAEWRMASAHVALVRLAGDAARPDLRPGAIDACVAVNAVGSTATLGAIVGRGAEPISLRQKAATALGAIDSDAARSELASRLPSAPQQVSVSIAASLAQRRAGAERLLAAIREGKASVGLLQEATVIERLRAARIPKLDEAVAELTKNAPPGNPRLAKLIDERRAAYDRSPHDLALGATVFKKQCAICHRLGGEGAKIGPDLDGIGNRGLDRIVEDLLDPNRNLDQAFRATNIRTADGLNLTGLVLGTEAEVVVLADAQGKQIRVPVVDIESRTISNLSPMPANVAELVAEADFYHLVAYLLAQSKPAP